jgi:hypothetical protein
MAAWRHHASWKNGSYYAGYRRYVGHRAPHMEKSTDDCADLSVNILIEFASLNGLCVSFTDDRGARFISKAAQATSPGIVTGFRNEWKRLFWGDDKQKFIEVVKANIGARNLFQHNFVINKRGPEVGDLMANAGHTALVYAVYPPKTLHPLGDNYVDKANPKNPASIPRFPGDGVAQTQLDQTRYFRDEPPVRLPIVLPSTPAIHFDYLNHRGHGGKDKAELILYANVDELKKESFDFFSYSPSVLDDWTDWDGLGIPPR